MAVTASCCESYIYLYLSPSLSLPLHIYRYIYICTSMADRSCCSRASLSCARSALTAVSASCCEMRASSWYACLRAASSEVARNDSCSMSRAVVIWGGWFGVKQRSSSRETVVPMIGAMGGQWVNPNSAKYFMIYYNYKSIIIIYIYM